MGVCMAMHETSAGDVEEALYGDGGGGGASVDLDKAWHAIHYALTGQVDDDGSPLSGAILGGDSLDEDEEEGGIYLSAERVRETAAALALIDETRFSALFGDRNWNDRRVYGGGWELEHLLAFFDEVRQFFQEVAARGTAVMKIFY